MRALPEDETQRLDTLQLSRESDSASVAERRTSNLFAGPSVSSPGDVLGGKYTIKAVLGTGSNAVTYQAVTPDGRDVAVKALSLKGMRDWKQLELFQREAQVLKGLSHPNIPKYIDYFEQDTATDRSFYIVQEVARGKSLAQMLADGDRATEAETLRIAESLLSILTYLAGLSPAVTHRDVKPDNIVLEGGKWGGRVYLVDFGGVQGAASVSDDSSTSLGSIGSTIIGTYGYMAPEQFRGQAQPASDLYALGGTLLFLVSGQAPSQFPQNRMRLAWRDQLTVGPKLSALLDGLLEPIVEDRLTAAEAVELLTARTDARGQRSRMERRSSSEGASTIPARPGTLRRPAGTRVQLTRTPNRLEIEIPPEGVNSNSLGVGAFALAWNAFVAFWTISAIASGGLFFALFSAPFWFAGAQLTQQALGASMLRERFAVGRGKFRLSQELAVLQRGAPKFLGGGGGNERLKEGETPDLTGARVVTTMIVNGVPRTAIELVEGVNRYKFGEGLSTVEQNWLVSEINQHLAQLRGVRPSVSDMAPAEPPRIVNDDTNDSRFGSWDESNGVKEYDWEEDKWNRVARRSGQVRPLRPGAAYYRMRRPGVGLWVF